MLVVLQMKLYNTRKFIHISTIFWFYRKIAGLLRAITIPTGFVVKDSLQRIICSQLLNDSSNLRLKKRSVSLMSRIAEMMPISVERIHESFCCFSLLTETSNTRELLCAMGQLISEIASPIFVRVY